MLARLLKELLSKLRRREAPGEPAPLIDSDKPIVIGVSGPTLGKALEGSTRTLGQLLTRHGYHYHEVDGGQPGAFPQLARLVAANEVAFGFGMAGFGGEPAIWSASATPFFRIMGDHPAYFLQRHMEAAPNIVNLYTYGEHWDFYRRYVARGAISGLLFTAPLDPVQRSQVAPRKKAAGRVLFLKNGNDPNQLVALWRERLPRPVAKALSELGEALGARLDRANADDIEKAVLDYFAERSIDLMSSVRLFALYVAQLDDYVRRLKSTLIATALLDHPIEVHGYHWNHVDFGGRRATLVDHADYSLSRSLIHDALAIIDMSPNTDSLPHERVLRALGRFTVCLTNRNRWLHEHLSAYDRYTFDFTPDSIRAALERLLADPAAGVELGFALGDELRAKVPEERAVRYLETLADHVRTACRPGPAPQEYFVWPS